MSDWEAAKAKAQAAQNERVLDQAAAAVNEAQRVDMEHRIEQVALRYEAIVLQFDRQLAATGYAEMQSASFIRHKTSFFGSSHRSNHKGPIMFVQNVGTEAYRVGESANAPRSSHFMGLAFSPTIRPTLTGNFKTGTSEQLPYTLLRDTSATADAVRNLRKVLTNNRTLGVEPEHQLEVLAEGLAAWVIANNRTDIDLDL